MWVQIKDVDVRMKIFTVNKVEDDSIKGIIYITPYVGEKGSDER